MSELKLVFAGPMGAGKTTAIRAISEIEPIATEVANTDTAEYDKLETTVALDYGELTLAGGDKLRLYGTPGQVRFDFMWEIVATGALGVVILLDNSRPEVMEHLAQYVRAFHDLAAAGAVVVAVGRMDTHPLPSLETYTDALEKMGVLVPVMPADVRQRDSVVDVLEVLFQQIEIAEDGESSADDWFDFIRDAVRND